MATLQDMIDRHLRQKRVLILAITTDNKHENCANGYVLFVSVPSPPRTVSVKSKEGTRLVLQWRKPEETNGIIKKYVPHFSDTDEVTNAYTMHSSEEEE